jgi:hypothetical protein
MSASSKFGHKLLGRTLPPICKTPPNPPIPILPWPPPYILCSVSARYAPPWQPLANLVAFRRLTRLALLNKYEATIIKGGSTVKVEVILGVVPPSCQITLTHWVHGAISPPPMTTLIAPIPINPFEVENRTWLPQSVFATDYVHLYA